MLSGPLLAMAVIAALLGWLVTWIAAWRYGRRRALVVPILALAAVAVLVWRTGQSGGHDLMGVVPVALALGGPAVAGAMLGLVFAPGRDS
jgi:hypothetical protein